MSLPTHKRIEKELESDFRILSKCGNVYEYNYLLDILIKKLRKKEFDFFAFAANDGISFLLDKIGSYDLKAGISVLPAGDQIAISKILNIVNTYFYIDQAGNAILNYLFTAKSGDLNLSEFKEAVAKQLPLS